jgi:hypothetical protein
MSAELLIALGVLAWLAVAILTLGLCWAAKRGDAALERRLRDVSR